MDVSVVTQSSPAGATLTRRLRRGRAGDDARASRSRVPQTRERRRRTGFVVLTRGSDVRRVPFWFHVEVPKLRLDPHHDADRCPASTAATPPASRHASRPIATRSAASRRASRRSSAARSRSSGSRLRKPVANFGVVVLTRATACMSRPRLVRNGDENQLVGYTGLPASAQPVRRLPRRRCPSSAPSCPRPGTYDFVFDTPTRTDSPARSRSASGSTTRRRPRSRCSTATVVAGHADPARRARRGRRRRPQLARRVRSAAPTSRSRTRTASLSIPTARPPRRAQDHARVSRPTTRRRRTWRTSGRCSRTPASFRASVTMPLPLAVVDRRQVREVALDARRELVRLVVATTRRFAFASPARARRRALLRNAPRAAATPLRRRARPLPRARRCTASSRADSSGARLPRRRAPRACRGGTRGTARRRAARRRHARAAPAAANVRPQRWTFSPSHSRSGPNSPRSNCASRSPSSLVARSHSWIEMTLPSAYVGK